MNILRKLDRIHPPHSTLLSLAMCVILGLCLKYFRPEAGGFGQGIIIGAVLAIVIKKLAECSDRAVWRALTGKPESKD